MEKMETTIVYIIGYILRYIYWGFRVIIKKKMETAIRGLYRV